MIKPTVGRVVWFWIDAAAKRTGGGPQAAIITHVWGDRMVNLVVFDPNGVSSGRTSIALVQEGDAEPEYAFCTWMPFQVGQAKAATTAEAK